MIDDAFVEEDAFVIENNAFSNSSFSNGAFSNNAFSPSVSNFSGFSASPLLTFVNPHQPNKQAAVSPPDLRLGIVTWNVAHFGAESADLWPALKAINVAKDNLFAFIGDDATNILWDAVFSLEDLDQVFLDTDVAGIRNWLWKLEAFTKPDPIDRLENEWSEFYGDWEDVFGDDDEVIPEDNDNSAKKNPEITARSLLVSNRVKCLQGTSRLRDAAKPFFFSDAKREFYKACPFASDQLYVNRTALTKLMALGATFFHAVVRLDKALHKLAVVMSVVEMFRDNEWLDLMIVQEINDSANFCAELKAYATKSNISLSWECGQLMQSVSGDASQYEYYAIICRSHSGKKISVQQSKLAVTSGKIINFTKKAYEWNKSAKTPTYRPIVLYEVMVAEVELLIGAVHTTPFGDEDKMERCDVFAELEATLAKIQEVYGGKRPLIIGGDYYLTGEARVMSTKSLNSEQKSILIEAWANELREINKALRNSNKKAKTEHKVEQEIQEKYQTFKNGKISPAWFTIQLNRFRNVTPKLLDKWNTTVKHTLEFADWQVEQTVTGTNWDDEDKGWSAIRIADFFLTRGWKSSERGLVTCLGGLLVVDTEKLDHGRYWRLMSDHFPVGGCFSTRQGDPWVKKAFKRSSKAELNADLINLDIRQNRWGARQQPTFGPLSPEDFESESTGPVVINPTRNQGHI